MPDERIEKAAIAVFAAQINWAEPSCGDGRSPSKGRSISSSSKASCNRCSFGFRVSIGGSQTGGRP